MAFSQTKINTHGLLLALLLGVLFSWGVSSVEASTFMPLPGTENLNVPTPQGNTALERLEDLLGPLARNLRIIVGAVAVLFIVVSGMQLVISGDNEEAYKNQRKSMTYAVIGLMMISIAGPIAEVFDYRQGNFLDDPTKFVERAQLFDDTTRIIVTFLKYLLGALASLMAVRSGALMVAQGDSEEVVGKEKKNLVLGAAGLILVVVSDLLIRNIFYSTEYNTESSETVIALNQNEFIRQLVAVTNIMVSFVGPILMLAIVAGGFLYVSAGGDEERTSLARKIMLNSVIGIVIIYGAFALVTTIISGTF